MGERSHTMLKKGGMSDIMLKGGGLGVILCLVGWWGAGDPSKSLGHDKEFIIVCS